MGWLSIFMKKSYNILTLNTHSYHEDDYLSKFKKTAQIIVERGIDFALLQEINQKNDGHDYEEISLSSSVHLINNELEKITGKKYNVEYAFNHNANLLTFTEGVMILSKHKLQNPRKFLFSKTSDINIYKRRVGLIVDAIINGEKISVCSVHCGWAHDKEDPFEYQLDQIKKNVVGIPNLIIGGDFNIPYNTKEYNEILIKLNVKDTYDYTIAPYNSIPGEIKGWEGLKEAIKIDHIFTNINYEESTSEIIFNGINENQVSDHFGVLARIEVK
jgi:maltose 6'-phosphate phosphatase